MCLTIPISTLVLRQQWEAPLLRLCKYIVSNAAAVVRMPYGSLTWCSCSGMEETRSRFTRSTDTTWEYSGPIQECVTCLHICGARDSAMMMMMMMMMVVVVVVVLVMIKIPSRVIQRATLERETYFIFDHQLPQRKQMARGVLTAASKMPFWQCSICSADAIRLLCDLIVALNTCYSAYSAIQSVVTDTPCCFHVYKKTGARYSTVLI